MNHDTSRWTTSFFNSRWELVAFILVLSVSLVSIFGLLGLTELAGLTSIVGFTLALPLAALFGDRLVEPDDEQETFADPVDELRTRYARGELSDAEFNRRLDRLLETEDVEVSDSSRERELEQLLE